MILYRRITRFEKAPGLIKYLSYWDAAFNTKAGMRFYPNKLASVVDVGITDSGDLEVFTMPHNSSLRTEKLAEDFYEVLLARVKELREKTHRSIWTVDLGTEAGPVFLTEDSFSNYYPTASVDDFLFIFKLPEKEGGFPQTYILPVTQQTGPFGDLVHVFTRTSHSAAAPINQTVFGKQFTVKLIRSLMKGGLNTECPTVDTLNFPSKKDAELPTTLNLTALKKFADKSGASKVIVTSKGIIEVPLPGQPLLPDATDDAMKTLEGHIKKSMEDSSSVSFMDAFNFGLAETLALANPEKVIRINMDMPDVAKKMCLFSGSVFIVPYKEDFSPGDFFGEVEELFTICDDDFYPAPANKNTKLQ